MSELFLIPRSLPRAAQVEAVFACIRKLREDKAYRVEVHEQKPLRTHSQNALLWAVYTQILERGGEDMGGWTKEDLHEFFLGDHFGWKVRTLWGQKRRIPARRSSKLDKREFSDYVDSIVRFMSDRGVTLDMPEEGHW